MSLHMLSQGMLLSDNFLCFLKVRHRWCELVVKHKYKKAYGHVERFLQEDQVSFIFQRTGIL